jgi:hypothetical protein
MTGPTSPSPSSAQLAGRRRPTGRTVRLGPPMARCDPRSPATLSRAAATDQCVWGVWRLVPAALRELARHRSDVGPGCAPAASTAFGASRRRRRDRSQAGPAAPALGTIHAPGMRRTCRRAVAGRPKGSWSQPAGWVRPGSAQPPDLPGKAPRQSRREEPTGIPLRQVSSRSRRTRLRVGRRRQSGRPRPSFHGVR